MKDLKGLKCVGKISNLQEKLCLYLLQIGGDPLLLNYNGISAIYVAMHYKNNYQIVSKMISISESNYDELNQTYIFPQYGPLSLIDIY